MVKTIRIGLAILAMYALYGCATPYKPYGSLGGYLDKEIAPNVYQVEYHGNGYTTYEAIEGHLRQRAGELCKSRGFHMGPIERTAKLERNPNALWIIHKFPVVTAEVRCKAA